MCRYCRIKSTNTGDCLYAENGGMLAIKDNGAMIVNINGEQTEFPISFCFNCGKPIIDESSALHRFTRAFIGGSKR